jgi:hypothetical protein
MKKILLLIMLLFVSILVGCSNSTTSIDKNETFEIETEVNKVLLEEVSKRGIDSLNYIKENLEFNHLKLKGGFVKVFSDGGCTDNACDVDAIFDGDKYYKLNKKNLQYLLKPYHSENEIIEYFEIIYSSKSTKKIYFLEEEKSKYEISYCDFSNIEFGCGNRGDLKFQEITLNEDFKEVEIKNLSKKIKKSEECIIYCFG